MHLFINGKQKKTKQQTCTNITQYNWVLMPCPSTVALQLHETFADSFQLFGRVGRVFPSRCAAEVVAALVEGTEMA